MVDSQIRGQETPIKIANRGDVLQLDGEKIERKKKGSSQKVLLGPTSRKGKLSSDRRGSSRNLLRPTISQKGNGGKEAGLQGPPRKSLASTKKLSEYPSLHEQREETPEMHAESPPRRRAMVVAVKKKKKPEGRGIAERAD